MTTNPARRDLEQTLFKILFDAGASFESNTVIPALTDAVEELYGYVPPSSETLPLDSEPWVEDGIRFPHHVYEYFTVGQLGTEFRPRERFEQNPIPYLQKYSRLLWKK